MTARSFAPVIGEALTAVRLNRAGCPTREVMGNEKLLLLAEAV